MRSIPGNSHRNCRRAEGQNVRRREEKRRAEQSRKENREEKREEKREERREKREERREEKRREEKRRAEQSRKENREEKREEKREERREKREEKRRGEKRRAKSEERRAKSEERREKREERREKREERREISDVYEKFAFEPLCPVEHNPEVHTTAYLDFDTVLHLDFQEARPAMSLCFSFPLVSGTFLVLLVVFSSFGQRFSLALFTVEHQPKALPAFWRQFSIAVDATCCGEQCSPILSGPVEQAGYMVKSMRLIPTNKVGQACERVGLQRLPREAGF